MNNSTRFLHKILILMKLRSFGVRGAGLLLLSVFLLGCATLSPPREIRPPVLTPVDIGTLPRSAQGDSIQLGPNSWLFVPMGYRVPASGAIVLTIHFHGEDWLAREACVRRSVLRPLITVTGLSNSNVYRSAFLEPDRLSRMLTDTEDYFRRHGAPSGTRVKGIEISSVGAGYAAVREILKSPQSVDLIQTVILADSLYAAFATPGVEGDRKPLPSQMEPFVNFARLAVQGKKTFLVTYCQLATTGYASTADTARDLVAQVEGEPTPVQPGALPASAPDLAYPLLVRYEKGGLHVWGYGGADAEAHVTHERALAEFWKALDTAAGR